MSFDNTFPAIRGVQAGRPCYIAMCPMRIVPKLFRFNEEDVPAELRAQRTLNLSRVPEITAYLSNNPNDYTLSCLTASVDKQVKFTPIMDTGLGMNMGTLSVPMDAHILINDGQHRRAAIEKAIEEHPELGHDNIPVLFFIDDGLARAQQMFADLNKHSVRPSESIGTLYDLRDELSGLARHVQKHVHVFSKMTELEKSSISNRSNKLFTLSAIKNATKTLLGLGQRPKYISKEQRQLSVDFWNSVSTNMTDWQMALNKQVATSELRENYIHAHGVMLQAMGFVGYQLLNDYQGVWKDKLSLLSEIDWSRSNPLWEGRAMSHGRISKAKTHVLLTSNSIKQKLGLALNELEQEAEKILTK